MSLLKLTVLVLCFHSLLLSMFGCTNPQNPIQPEVIDFRDLRLEHTKGKPIDLRQLPAKVQELDGQRITLTGYMNPTEEKQGITSFVLVRDNMEPIPLPFYEKAVVHLVEGKTAVFSTRPVDVTGRFQIVEPIRNEKGSIHTIYEIEAESVTRR